MIGAKTFLLLCDEEMNFDHKICRIMDKIMLKNAKFMDNKIM
jgi:hypothetical protein